MQHVFPIPLGDLPFLGYSGACRRQTGRDHPRFWRCPPRRHLSSFYAPARYFTQKASSGTALRTNCLPEARERKERTPKKERKKLKPRPPPRRKAGKQKNFSGTRKNRAPPENPILPGTWGGKRSRQAPPGGGSDALREASLPAGGKMTTSGPPKTTPRARSQGGNIFSYFSRTGAWRIEHGRAEF